MVEMGLGKENSNKVGHSKFANQLERTVSNMWSKAPFVMPSDEEVLQLRASEKQKWREQKKQEGKLSVVDKTTFASRLGATTFSPELKKDMEDINARVAKEIEDAKIVTVLPVEHYHKERENMAEFIAKKREIFLVQMSLDTKRAEIRKLEDKIFQREEALRKSEEMLAEDSLEFDMFLKANDEKVQDAIRRAEQQTKLKQDKLGEMKRLNGTISAIKRDLNKYQEQLEECRKYMDFLLSLTPKKWILEQQAAGKFLYTDIEAGRANVNEDEDNANEPMYFKEPKQLLEIFSELEAKNLALMQECQDSENSLEDLRTKFRETQTTNDGKISNLHAQIEGLKLAMKCEEEKQQSLKDGTNFNMVDRNHEFDEIVQHVYTVYARCGFEPDPSLGPVQMLTNIEMKLDENLVILESIPADFIDQSEKTREKDRRLKIREERIEKQREEQEKRALRSLERAQAPIHRRMGKPPMFRSRLIKKVKQEVEEVQTNEDKDLGDFLARAY